MRRDGEDFINPEAGDPGRFDPDQVDYGNVESISLATRAISRLSRDLFAFGHRKDGGLHLLAEVEQRWIDQIADVTA
jgi:hypothetical protein